MFVNAWKIRTTDLDRHPGKVMIPEYRVKEVPAMNQGLLTIQIQNKI